MQPFDPYHRWLGIPPAEQPAHFYRLLGIAPFESDPSVIHEAADRQMAHVKRHAGGAQAALTQQVLNELATARLCLQRPEEKARYDAALRQRLLPRAVPVAMPQAAPVVPEAPANRWLWLAAAGGGSLSGLLLLLILAWWNSGPAPQPEATPTPVSEPSVTADEPEPQPAAERTDAELALESQGLTAEIFEGAEFDRLVETRVEPQVNAFWGSGSPAEGVPADEFSVRWSGWLRPPVSGVYRLRLVADDEAAVAIEEAEILRHEGRAEPFAETSLELENRPYQIKIEHRERSAGAWVSLRWKTPGGEDEAIPAWAFYQDEPSAAAAPVNELARAHQARPPFDQRPKQKAGLSGELFAGEDFRTRLATRVDRVIDVYWALPGILPPLASAPRTPGQSVPAEPADAADPPAGDDAAPPDTAGGDGTEGDSAGENDDNNDDQNDNDPPTTDWPETFSARWRGWLTPPAAGRYTLVAVVDDGVRVWIDRKLRLDAYRVGYPQRFEGDVQLSAPPHEIRIEYFRRSGDGLLSLRWITPAGVEEVIPAACFTHMP